MIGLEDWRIGGLDFFKNKDKSLLKLIQYLLN